MKNNNPSKPEQLFVDLKVGETFSCAYDGVPTSNDMKSMLKVAKEIRNQISWKFTGDFSSYKAPTMLLVLLKWILFGPYSTEDYENTQEMNNLLKISSQFIAQNIKTKRQTNYHLIQRSQTLSSVIEIPLNVGSGIAFYHATRSKKLVNFLSDLNVSSTSKKASLKLY